jgi:aminopeptidase S
VKFRFTFAHDAAATPADYLRLGIVRGGSTNAIWTASGKSAERNAAWTTKTFSLTAYAGQTIRLKFTAVDGAADSLVEAAIDNVRVYQKL